MQSEPKTLDDLLDRGEHYARYSMTNSGRVIPALFAIAPDHPHPFMFVPENLADERAKDTFANTARLMCIARAATAAVMVLEAWAKFAKPGEPLDPTEAPSEAFDRQEVVLLIGEDRRTQKQKLLPIIRTDAGGFFNFGESQAPEGTEFQGRFAQILPPNPPTPDQQTMAHTLLKAMNVQFTRPRS